MTTSTKHVVEEMIRLLKSSPADEASFFEEEKNHKWLEYLIPHGFFNKETIKPLVQEGNSYYYPAWPQGYYLEAIAQNIQSNQIAEGDFIKIFLDLLRSFYSTRENLWAIRSIFRSVFCIPVSYLSPQDVSACFDMIEVISARNDYTEFDLHESYFNIIRTVRDNEHDRSTFREYTKCLLRSRLEDKFGIRERKLIFFSDHRIKFFTEKFYKTQKTIDAFVLQDIISIVSNLLAEHVESDKINETSSRWRPSIEPHEQNRFHDSAPSVFTAILYEVAKTLLERNTTPLRIEEWKKSNKFIFSRLYIALASKFPEMLDPNETIKTILKLGLRHHYRYEVYHFLEAHFESLESSYKDLVLSKINELKDKYSDENDPRKPTFTAWKKMRWLQALKGSSYPQAKELYSDIYKITNGESDHPDFDSFVGATWVGPTSPISLDDFDKLSAHEIVIKLAEYKDKKDRFGEPSIEGLSRVFENYVTKEPRKSSVLIKEMSKLPFIYHSAMFDGYTKCRVDQLKHVPDEELLNLAISLFNNEHFITELSNPDSKNRWTANSIFRFISAGVRDDKTAFKPSLNVKCHEILKKAVYIIKPSEDYKGSSDAQTRAINEPRGVLFETAILLALREARLAFDKKDKSSKDSEQFKQAWINLYGLIKAPLESQDTNEVSLHAHLGSLYRQIMFLNHDWVFNNIDLLCPFEPEKEDLWSAFMQGFCYVNVNVKEMYQILYQKGHLLKFLRYSQESENKNSGRLDTLQERIIALALVSYVLKTDTLTDGLLSEVLRHEDEDEWNRMIHFIPRIIGNKPTKSILNQTTKLLTYFADKFDSVEDKMRWKKHFSSMGWVLPIFKDPNDPLVARIIRIEAFYTNDSWDHYEIINYLEPFKDSHTETVGKLFLELVKSGKGYPGYPEDKIKAICSSIKTNGFSPLLADICNAYAEKSPGSSLTKSIFGFME